VPRAPVISIHTFLYSCFMISIKTKFGSSLPPVVCRRVLSYLHYLCLCIVVSNVYCVVFLFCLSSSCVSYVVSFSWLSVFDCPFRILLRLFIKLTFFYTPGNRTISVLLWLSSIIFFAIVFVHIICNILSFQMFIWTEITICVLSICLVFFLVKVWWTKQNRYKYNLIVVRMYFFTFI
jgi:hypothetical protein